MGPSDFVKALRDEPDGPAMLLNMAHALDREGLIDEADVASFLERCAAWHGAQPAPAAGEPPVSPMRSLREVGNGDDGLHPWRRRLKVASHDGQLLTTLVKWEDWYVHHVDQELLDAHGIDKIRKPEALHAHAKLADHLDEVCALQPWWKTGHHASPACLGGPISGGANVWFSTVDHDAGHAVPAADVRGTAHLLARATGLVYDEGTWLLQYSVDADEVRSLAKAEVARPLFGDGGNAWFRIHNASPYGRHCAGLGWGNTAHLAPADAVSANDGRPERVVLRLPLDALSSLRLRLVGQVRADAQDPPVLSPVRFGEMLLGGGTLDTIVARLLACRA